MCGRFTLTKKDPRQIALELGVDPDAFVDYRPRYNIAPTDPHWIVRDKYEQRQLLPATWGLVNTWAKDAKRAVRPDQCAARDAREDAGVPRGIPEAALHHSRRRVLRVDRPEGRTPAGLVPSRGRWPDLFAGLTSPGSRSRSEWQRTFTIVTTDANGLMAPIHDRMPVVLDRRQPRCLALPEGTDDVEDSSQSCLSRPPTIS